MNDRRSSSDLGSSSEAALGAFPFPERDWESQARAIEARLTDSVRGSTDAQLLAAPLPSASDEPSSASATATPVTNSGVRTQSLAELARRSVEKKQVNERLMARESLAIAAQQRQLALPTEPTSAPAKISHVAAISQARESAPSTSASQRAPANQRALKVAVALPALALAAAALFWFRRPEPAPLVTTAIAPAAPSAVLPGAIAAGTVGDRPATAQDAPHGIDPSTLPGETPAIAELAPPKLAVSGKPVANKPTLQNGHVAAVGPADDDSLPPDPALRPADSRGGDLPTKPTTGAVQVALGAVMGGARHCVAGDDAPSRAVVVFGSDGRVRHVTVSGAAAGTSAASCIEAQLSRARVQPFAASSFSVNATVRPE